MREAHEPHPQCDDGPHGRPGFWRSKMGLATIVFLAAAAFLLFSEHRAHALGVLPYLLLLACPAMHFFMHGRHGGRGGNERRPDPPSQGD